MCFFEFFSRFLLHFGVHLQQDCNDQIYDHQIYNDKKGDEIEARPQRSGDICKNCRHNPPIIHDHIGKECHNTWRKIIEIYQIIQGRNAWVVNLSRTFSDQTTKSVHSKECVNVKDHVKGCNHDKHRSGTIDQKFHDYFKTPYFSQKVKYAQISHDERHLNPSYSICEFRNAILSRNAVHAVSFHRKVDKF